MSALEFQLNLSGTFASALDRVGKAAKESGKELTATEKATKALENEFQRVEGQLAALKAAPDQFRKMAAAQRELLEVQKQLAGVSVADRIKEAGEAKIGGFTFDLAEILTEGIHSAVDVVHELTAEFVELGKEMVHVAGDTQDLNLAVKLNVGEEGANKVNELSESFEKYSRFDGNDIKKALLPILEENGVKDEKTLEDITTAATDISARRKTGLAGVEAALGSFQQIALRREVNPKLLKELGVNAQDYFKDLGSLYGITATHAEKMAKEGKFKAQTLISVALNQIAQREGGQLGNATMEASKTLGATLEKLGNLKENLFEKIANSSGMAAVQRFLDSFVEVMGGPEGEQLITHLSDILSDVFGGPESDVDGIKETLKEAVRLGGELVDAGKALADALLPSLNTVQDLVIGLREFVALSSGDKAGFEAAVKEELDVKARRLVKGYQKMNELAGKFAAENTANVGLSGMSIASGFEDEAGGVSIPQFADGGVVNGPTIALIGEDGPEAVVPLRRAFNETAFGNSTGGGGGFARDISFAPVFQLAAGTSSDVRDQLEQAGQAWRQELARFVDELAARTGAAP
jgi:hypothetical protein